MATKRGAKETGKQQQRVELGSHAAAGVQRANSHPYAQYCNALAVTMAAGWAEAQ